MDDLRIVPFGMRIENDLVIDDVEILGIRFVPQLSSKSQKVYIKYKQFTISFGSLPDELQKQIKQVVMERITQQFEQEKQR